MKRVHSNDFVNFEVWDFPGQNDPFEKNSFNGYEVEQLLENCGAIVFVLDCRELIDDACARLLDTICAAYRVNPQLSVEVFIHKVDALSEDHQADLLAILQRRVEEDARQRLEMRSQLRLNFNLTSIYDHSVFQAFSVVVQKLIQPRLQYINELLEMLNGTCNAVYSYLFLSRSKIYLASAERHRVKSRTYDLCSDAIDVVIKTSDIYTPLAVAAHAARKNRGAADNGSNSGTKAATVSVRTTGDLDDGNGAMVDPTSAEFKRSVIDLNTDECIYVRELPNSLAIVLMIERNKLQYRSMIDHNINIFFKAVQEIFNFH
ncbi:small GTPase [Strigomonas culicis]|nr:small GTPase [Strigomonas culicis]|eukprot:EPY30972.1 small GTPase [Strigomonas culicis]